MTPSRDLHRRNVLRLGIVLVAGMALDLTGGITSPAPAAEEPSPMAEKDPGASRDRMPVLFVGHGSPVNAIEENEWSRGFRAPADLLPRPRAILSISAHWYIPGTAVTGNPRPQTIRDFGGFQQELFDMQYPAQGDIELAERVVGLLGTGRAPVRTDWGLDHATWSVLHHLRPEANCRVVQLSIDEGPAPQDHVEIGRLSHPTPEHHLPLLYAAGAADQRDPMRFPIVGFDMGSLSMRSVILG